MATQVDAVLKVAGEDGTSRPLSIDDLKTGRTGAATEATLAEVLAALGGKLEPADLAALATAANQAAAKNVLDAINAALGVPAGSNTALALLTTIAANTGTETTTVQELNLTAEQVQLDVDGVEALLAHLTDGTAQFKFAPPASATPGNVPASTSNVTLAAANASRRGLYVYNDSTANLYLKLGATASTSSFTVKIPAGGLYELPVPFYRGQVDGIWDAANGNARITELS
jgi:hypothetical protein